MTFSFPFVAQYAIIGVNGPILPWRPSMTREIGMVNRTRSAPRWIAISARDDSPFARPASLL
jgi:hypothetical protein